MKNKKMDKGVKEYYKVYSIKELEGLIKIVKRNGCKKNVKKKNATVVLNFVEHEEYEGQLVDMEDYKILKRIRERREEHEGGNQ